MNTPIIDLDLTKQAPQKTSTFEWLEADDRASFKSKAA